MLQEGKIYSCPALPLPYSTLSSRFENGSLIFCLCILMTVGSHHLWQPSSLNKWLFDTYHHCQTPLLTDYRLPSWPTHYHTPLLFFELKGCWRDGQRHIQRQIHALHGELYTNQILLILLMTIKIKWSGAMEALVETFLYHLSSTSLLLSLITLHHYIVTDGKHGCVRRFDLQWLLLPWPWSLRLQLHLQIPWVGR